MALEIYDYQGEGYRSVMSYGAWRVAFLNPADCLREVHKLERHMESDEVFLLLRGDAILFIGEEMQQVRMEKHKVYNVTAGTWHAVCVSPDARVFIVENADVSQSNSEYIHFTTPPCTCTFSNE